MASSIGPPIGYATAGAMPELIDAARPRLAADGVPMDDAAITAITAITVTAGTLDAIERLPTVHVRPGDAVEPLAEAVAAAAFRGRRRWPVPVMPAPVPAVVKWAGIG